MRSVLLFLLAAAVLLAAAPTGRSAAASALPAPVAGPAPTLSITPDHGYAGQTVRVSGQAVAALPGVRVAWLLADATYTVALADRQADGSYSAEVAVPPEAALGTARICAAPTGAESAAFACANFSVEAPPPAGLDITLPADLLPPAEAFGAPALAAADPMRLSLLDAAGGEVASALVGPSGRIQIASIPPGVYQASVSGAVGQPFELGLIALDAGRVQTQFDLGRMVARMDPVTGKACTNEEARVSAVRAQFADGASFSPAAPAAGGSPSDMRARSLAATSRLVTFYDPSRPFVQPPLGWFISGVRLDNQIQVRVQERYLRSVVSVRVYVRPAGSETWQRIRTVARGADGRMLFSYNVGDLPPGTSELAFEPVLPGNILIPAPVQCSQRVPVNVAADPTVGGSISGTTVWNPAGYYSFSGTMSGAPGLPSVIADPQYQNSSRNMGDLSSNQGTTMQVSGQVGLDRVVTLSAWQSAPSAQLFGQPTAGGQRPLIQPGAVGFGGLDPRNISFSSGKQTIWRDYKRIKFFEGVVFSYFGIVNVKIGAGIFFGGEVSFSATIYPLQPQFDAQLDSYVTAGGYVSIAADLLGGIVEGGVNIGVAVSLSLPLSIGVGQRNEVALRNECVKINGYLTVYWSAVWGLFGDESDPATLFDAYAPRGCKPLPVLPFAQSATLAAAEGAPRVMPQPAAAAGAGGRMIALAIEDATPDAPSASPQVVARAWNPLAQAWGDPTPLSDGAHLVDRPTVAFYGDGARAVAAWAQLDLSATESADGRPFAEQARHMEIYAALYDGVSWGAPQPVTADLLIDARPSLAGSAGGATLAWVRDTDGDTATRDDSHIAVARWDGAWGPIELLGGGVSQPGTTLPFGRGPDALDGSCDPEEYRAASHFQFADAGGAAGDLWLRHDGESLLACVRGPAGSFAQRAYHLRLDPQDARSALAQPADIQISVPLDGSAPSAQIGDGGGSYVDSPDILGWQAAGASGAADSAEFRLPLSMVGGVCDRSFGLSVTHTWVGGVSDDYPWRPDAAWNSPQTWGRAVIECPGENTQPDAAAAETGSLAGGDYSARVGLAWTYDADGDALTGADRRLALASASSPREQLWRTLAPQGLPAGAQTPSVAVGAHAGGAPDSLLLSFAAPFIDRTGQLVAVSDQGEVWTAEARDDDGAWAFAARRLTDEADLPLRGERPQVWAGADGEALVLFRRFGDGATTATLGQLALVQARRDNAGAVSSYSPPRYLTGGFSQQWQPALVVNPATGELIALSGALPPALNAEQAARLRSFLTDEPAPPSAPAGPGGLTLSRLEAGPDPALDPQLALSQRHAPAGSTVTVSATVTNLGRGAVASPAQIFFYAGEPGVGEPIAAYEIGPLAFGESQQFSIALAADGAAQPVSAELVAAGDSERANNSARADLGALAAPAILSAAPSALWPGAVEVALAAAPGEGAAGYRIYRRSDAAGGYELVGETAGARLYDLLLASGVAPCYVARAFDSAGALSPPSAEVCAAAVGQAVYLPMVRR